MRRSYEDRLETQELHHLAELERLQRELYQRCRCETNTTQTQWEDAPAAFAFTAQQPSGGTGAAPLPLAVEGTELQDELSGVIAHVMTAGAFRAALLRLQLEDQQRLLVAQAGTSRAGASSRDVEHLRQLAKDTAAECDRCGFLCFLVRQTDAALVAFTSRFLSPRSLCSSKSSFVAEYQLHLCLCRRGALLAGVEAALIELQSIADDREGKAAALQRELTAQHNVTAQAHAHLRATEGHLLEAQDAMAHLNSRVCGSLIVRNFH